MVEGQRFSAGRMVSDPLFFLSPWQAGRKTYAMVSSRSTSHSLASELVESNDGHEEIIKVGLAPLHGFSLLSFSLQAEERKWLPSPKGPCGLTGKNQICEAGSWLCVSWKDLN